MDRSPLLPNLKSFAGAQFGDVCGMHPAGALAGGPKALAKAGGDPWARLMALGQAHFTFAAQHPDYFRVMFESRAANKPQITRTVIPTFRRVVEAVEDCQREALIAEGNPWDLAVTTRAVFHGLAALFLNGPLGDRSSRAKRLERTVASVFERGMRAPRVPRTAKR
jgi:AcrR family transcriptional regulator